MEHVSVLKNETINLLNIDPDGVYVDATLGRGGHALELVKRLNNGCLYAFDKDQQAINESKTVLEGYEDKVIFIKSDYRYLKQVLQEHGVKEVNGIMMDLGVSSPQFDDPERGFSYRFDAKLDMRMDQEQSLTAYEVVNTYSQEDLVHIFSKYGEERYSKAIASNIVKKRTQRPIETTFELVDVIKESLPEKELRKKGHPAKQVFQAIRIEVNDELKALEICLHDACEMLAVKGRCVVITFHSLEDRIVKQYFKELSAAPFVEPKLPLKVEQMEQASFSNLTKKPIIADEEERQYNNRAHSAKLRGIERIK